MAGRGSSTLLDDAALRRILERAYVPEHVPGLMAILSDGTPHLLADHLILTGEHGVIVVGYPLDDRFSEARIDDVLRTVRERWRPEQLAYIGPGLPPSLRGEANDVVEDTYYALDVGVDPPARWMRVADKAAAVLTVHEGRDLEPSHVELLAAFRRDVSLPPPVDRLYAKMPDYVARSETAHVLSARDHGGRLLAFFILESAARGFDAYLLGCRQMDADLPHASDLLMRALIERTRAAGKPRIDLGLGVNDGIRRFKAKWGGRPGRPYVSCELSLRRPSPLSLLRHLWGAGS